MIVSRSIGAAGAALLLVSATGANAADLFGGNGSMKDTFIAPLQTSGTGWYFRLDGGYAIHDNPNITLGSTTADLTSPTMGNAWTAGGGVGYHFSRNVRADVTYDHRFSSDVAGVQSYTIPKTIGPSNLTGHAGLTSEVVLANLYYDFDTGKRLTPYIGAGLGFAHHSLAAGTIDNDCACNFTGALGPGTSDTVAGALMAGVAWQISGAAPTYGGSTKDGGGYQIAGSRNLSLDLGYRFLYLGEVQTGAVGLTDTTTGTAYAVANKATVEDIRAHEFRLGVRYDLR